jgi:hypothetical protein
MNRVDGAVAGASLWFARIVWSSPAMIAANPSAGLPAATSA